MLYNVMYIYKQGCSNIRRNRHRDDYETVGILPLISRKTLGILGDGGAGEAADGGGAWRGGKF